MPECPSVLLLQKYEKPKFIQCLTFLRNGDILTGDSGGILLIWTRSTTDTPPAKGPRGTSPPTITTLLVSRVT